MCMIITEDCINSASCGAICVQCNSCGRFGGSSKVIQKSKLYMLTSELKEYMEHINNEEYDTLLQQKNIVSSINSISKQCVDILTELGAFKEVPEDCFDMSGLKIKYSEWINSED